MRVRLMTVAVVLWTAAFNNALAAGQLVGPKGSTPAQHKADIEQCKVETKQKLADPAVRAELKKGASNYAGGQVAFWFLFAGPIAAMTEAAQSNENEKRYIVGAAKVLFGRCLVKKGYSVKKPGSAAAPAASDITR